MQKRSKIIAALMIICTILLLIVVAATAYYMGLQHQKSVVEVLQNERAVLVHQAAQSAQNASMALNKTTVNYDTACLEYQKLYTAYTTLYLKTGASSGQSRYTAPDSARDNPDSCYH